MIFRAFRYRLTPTVEQEMTLAQFAGVTRLVYNLALEQRRDFWRRYPGRLDSVSQGRQVTDLRREYDWIKAVPSGALTQALRDLDKAFAAFFTGRARFPTPRKKGTNDSFRVQAKDAAVRHINGRWSEIFVPKLGWVRMRDTRPIVGRRLSVTVSRETLGWFASISCEIDREVPTNAGQAIGIDRGIAVSLALSNGEMFNLPDLGALDRRKRRAQRVLARRKKGSRHYAKQRLRLSRIAAKIGRVRADWQHRVSRDIADRFGLVAIEALNIEAMSTKGSTAQKRGLNRSIRNQGWSAFAEKLAYKLEERGGTLVKVPAAYSSQTCSDCGAVDAESRKNQSAFVCTACGFALNADHNAARVILRRSTPVTPVEDARWGSDETGTSQALAA